MLVNAEQQHTPSKTSAARGCGPTTFCASPVHDSSPDEAMSEFLENKAIISDPSDAERPPSVILESSGSEQYSVCIHNPIVLHSLTPSCRMKRIVLRFGTYIFSLSRVLTLSNRFIQGPTRYSDLYPIFIQRAARGCIFQYVLFFS